MRVCSSEFRGAHEVTKHRLNVGSPPLAFGEGILLRFGQSYWLLNDMRRETFKEMTSLIKPSSPSSNKDICLEIINPNNLS